MPQDDHDGMPQLAANCQSATCQFRTDPLALMVGQNRHWCQGQSGNGFARRHDQQIAKEDMANDLPVDLGDQGQSSVSPISQGIDKSSFVVATESEAIDCADGFHVVRGLRSSRDHEVRRMLQSQSHLLCENIQSLRFQPVGGGWNHPNKLNEEYQF